MSDARRRLVGFLVGGLLGLPYSIISQFVTVWQLPGVPLFEPPMGRVTTIIATTLALGLLGLLVAWEKDSFWGIVVGALFTVIASSYLAFVNSGSPQPEKTLLLFIFTFLPRLVLYVPLTLLLRWIMVQLERAEDEVAGSLGRRLLAALVLVLAAVIGGSFSMLSTGARQAMLDANALTQAGLAAAFQQAAMPGPLVPVEGFSQYAVGPYTLQWSDQVDSLNVLRPETAEPVIESLIIVRFQNGYKFGCVYTPPGRLPKCINITPVR